MNGQNSLDTPSPETTLKGEQKIQINSHLTAVCLVGAAYLLSIDKSSSFLLVFIMCQILCPIPLLITSSLAYLKIMTTKNEVNKCFDTLAWWAHSLAYGMILNSLTLIAFDKGFVFVGWLFFVCYNFLFSVYTSINVYSIYKLSLNEENVKFTKSWIRKSLNIIIYFLISFLGVILPMIIFNWPYGKG